MSEEFHKLKCFRQKVNISCWATFPTCITCFQSLQLLLLEGYCSNERVDFNVRVCNGLNKLNYLLKYGTLENSCEGSTQFTNCISLAHLCGFFKFFLYN